MTEKEAFDSAALEDVQAAQGTLRGTRVLLELAVSTAGRELLAGTFDKLDALEIELNDVEQVLGGAV